MKTDRGRQSVKVLRPVWPSEIDRLCNVRVPPASYREKVLFPCEDSLESPAELRKLDDIAVRIAEILVPRDFLGAGKHIIQVFHSGLVPFGVPLVPHAQLHADFRGAVLVAEKDHFDIGMEKLPALERIALNDGRVAVKGLGGREQC